MIITLCGSSRFEEQFHLWNKALTLCGHRVFSLACFPSVEGEREWYDEADKAMLDVAHFGKIEASEAIVVLNVHAYIGPSTFKEIEFARAIGREVYFLESWAEGHGIVSSDYTHKPEWIESAKRYDVYGCRSPIDSFGRYPMDLFGPAGTKRSRMVEIVQSWEPKEESAGGG